MIDRSTSEIGSQKVTTQSESLFVTTTAVNTPSHPWLTANYERMVRAGHAYRGIDFRLADDPEDADFLLFVEFLGAVSWRRLSLAPIPAPP